MKTSIKEKIKTLKVDKQEKENEKEKIRIITKRITEKKKNPKSIRANQRNDFDRLCKKNEKLPKLFGKIAN